MSGIADALSHIRSTLPEGVELVAVSKFHPVEALQEAYAAGQRLFGESRIQELLAKIPALPADVRWHFVGTRRIALIESIDSERLLRLVDAESERAGIVSHVLLQVHVAQEETKFGLTPDELLDFFRRRAFERLRATHICGLMGMASNTDDMQRVKADFLAIASLKKQVQELCPDLCGFDTLSMGMSHDYPAAIEAGASLVRVGTAIFGERDY